MAVCPCINRRSGIIRINWNKLRYLSGLWNASHVMSASCFCSAISVMLFYWEMNIPGNISIYEALLLTLLGGCLSLTVTGIMRTVFPGISEIAFLAGPLPEELAKCLIVTIFLCRKKYNYGLQGILIGGAVGVGFSAMESAGYALQIFDIGIQNAMGTNIIIRSMADILVRRGVLAIGGHVVWAALYGGALALIKGKRKKCHRNVLANSLFWLTFSAAFLLHTAWNFSASYLAGKLPDSLVASLVKFEAGTVTQWVKIYRIDHTCLALTFLHYEKRQFVRWSALMKCIIMQLTAQNHKEAAAKNDKRKNEQEQEQPVHRSEPKEQHPEQKQEQPVHQSAQKEQHPEQQPIHEESEYRVDGSYSGSIWIIERQKHICSRQETPLIFGRRTEKCNVLFKNETKGISSIHCKVKWYNGKVLIKDLGSTYGTWLNEGTRLEPNKYYELPDQGVFYLGSKENMFFMGMK
mgnify:CR=1 FL=1